jgi:uncharacterized spore protein YtfJ
VLFILATNACVLPERKTAAALAASLPLTNSMPTTRSYKEIRSPTKQQNQELFGGGGGGGITITPVAFIVIEKGKCRMMQINNYTSSADRAVSMIPELVDKLTELLKAKDGKADEAETPAAE